ncbi:unnamed protein product [Mycena citricolor]|uniref:Guanine nucleotide-binding protein subunit beta-like protein n=1 Tax=Mycena citricolor TaxID=2018698 RepID=A0AAD2Q1H9_9AGAR|nr:unnamed protein product [Mycena citricolor]
MSESLRFLGSLKGHKGWVTAIATSSETPDVILSASRDKTIIVWQLTRDETGYGSPKRILHGHNHFVSDVVISSDGQFALSSSWDHTPVSGISTPVPRHVVSSATPPTFSLSASAPTTVKSFLVPVTEPSSCGTRSASASMTSRRMVTLSGTVSCVRFSPNVMNPVIVSCGWDKVVKVWELSKFKLKTNHYGHTGYINTISVSPDGSLAASGGKDGITMLWDLNEGKHLYSLEAGDIVNALVFSPNRYWLCAATASCVKIFDLESKSIVDELKPTFTEASEEGREPECVSIAWSADGQTLFAGFTDNHIRVWTVSS